MIRVLPPTLASLCYVAHNMREIDRREVFAGKLAEPDALAIDVLTTPGFVDVVWRDEKPAAAVGGRQAWPGVWNVFAFGTDAWPGVVTTVTKHIVRQLTPSIIAQGGWRGHCYSHELHTEAHAWLDWLGFQREGVLRQFGRDGSDFILFSWLAPDYLEKERWWGRRRQHAVV